MPADRRGLPKQRESRGPMEAAPGVGVHAASAAPTRQRHEPARWASDAERAHLEKMVKDAVDGHCAVTGIHGLPGSGKSHLVETLVAQAGGFTIVHLPADAHDDLSDPVWSKAFERADALEPEWRQSKGQDAKSDQLRRSVANAIRATGRRTGAPGAARPRELLCGAAALGRPHRQRSARPRAGATASSSSHGVTNRTAPPWPSRRRFQRTAATPTVDQSAEYLTDASGPAGALGARGALRATGGNPAAMLGSLVPLRRAAARIGPVSRSCADRTRIGRSVG